MMVHAKNLPSDDAMLSVLSATRKICPDEYAAVAAPVFASTPISSDRNLGDPELSTASILSRFGVSRASLFRMFEPYGGVRTYIMQRRVVRAVMDLEARRDEHGRMRQAVEQWGLSSQPNFNRTIRREFGTNPGGLFRMHSEPAGMYANSGRMLYEFLSRVAA